LIERFTTGGIVRGFRGEALTTEGLLYVLDEATWPPVLCDRVLARVARRILEGSAPPPLDAYPRELTEPQAIEVLVILRGGLGPRLWRSARAQSIAEGLNTAALAARKRWDERAETMGGPLGERLEDLDVHVAFLFDDGTFDRRAVSLIDALVKPRHGVAYEQPARWRYLLPRATHTADSPTDAYRELFRDNGLPEESFERKDMRLYRLRMRTVSVDQGSAGSRGAGVTAGSGN
jgi:AMMECR1 domain-containing protein